MDLVGRLRGRGRPSRRSGWVRAVPHPGRPAEFGDSRSSAHPTPPSLVEQGCRTNGSPLECSPLDCMAMTASPGRTRPGPSRPSPSTTRWPHRRRRTRRGPAARVLGGLAADQRAPRHDAALGDALDDRGDSFGNDATRGDVVGHEQGSAPRPPGRPRPSRPGRPRWCRGRPSPGRSPPWCRHRRSRWTGWSLVRRQRGGVEEPAKPPNRRSSRAAERVRSSPSSGRSPCRRPRWRPGTGVGMFIVEPLLGWVLCSSGSGVVEDRQGLAERRAGQAHLEQVLAEQALVG